MTEVIKITKPKRSPWLIDCPACQFVFERTSKAIAVSWANEHALTHNPTPRVEISDE